MKTNWLVSSLLLSSSAAMATRYYIDDPTINPFEYYIRSPEHASKNALRGLEYQLDSFGKST